MKVIDKTPLQNDKGEIDVLGRIQGTLKYGFSWYSDLEAQKTVIAQLERLLEKGFVLIRNFTLPNSEIVIPMILLGPGGVSVIHATNIKGFFEAKGDQWNVVNSGKASPASVNLMNRVGQWSRALQVYFNRQKISIPAPIESVLIAANPGAHIESMRPVARVVLSDAIKPFAASLVQARPLWRSDVIFDIADRIVNPRPPEQLEVPLSAPAPSQQTPETPPPTPSRASAIFNASEKAGPFNPADFDFAFEEEPEGQPDATEDVPQHLRETSPAQPLPRPSTTKPSKVFGMTTPQLALLVGMFVVECCILIGFGAVILLNR